MLRISVLNEPFSITLKAEGKIIQDWVAELRNAWLDIQEQAGTRKRIVDLFNVSFVDAAGRELLVEMHASGGKLRGAGPMISALIQEIEGLERPRRSRKLKTVLLSLIFIALMIGLAQRAFPQTDAAPVLTLQQAVVLAKDHNRQIKIQELELAKAADDVAIAKARRLPSLS